MYLLPMPNGLDQYLANRLTKVAFFQVVTDPKTADAKSSPTAWAMRLKPSC